MIITLLNVLLSIFLVIQQVIIFDGFVHIRSHFAHCILCRFFSVEHILNLCFYNRTCFREYTEKSTCIFRCRIVKLIDSCLELWVFCDVVFEYLFVMCCCCYREVSCLCVPVSLRLRRDQEFYEFPCCTEFFRIVVVQCPERCTTDGNTALIAGFDLREVCGTNLKFSVYILKDLFQGSCGTKCDRRFSCRKICQTCVAAFSYDRCEALVVKSLP